MDGRDERFRLHTTHGDLKLKNGDKLAVNFKQKNNQYIDIDYFINITQEYDYLSTFEPQTTSMSKKERIIGAGYGVLVFAFISAIATLANLNLLYIFSLLALFAVPMFIFMLQKRRILRFNTAQNAERERLDDIENRLYQAAA